ncbi:hypothetical protein [Faecalicoccus acidiformans]|uniref:hypothetical protein n=1 Tax=Faecalicoccus acidiformans TaxID=915173 RepID=UPI00320B51D6
MLSIYIVQSASLIQCDRQSQFDLACISQVKGLIFHNNQIRFCNWDLENLILIQEIQIHDTWVTFEDHETYFQCTYAKKEKKIRMHIYYDMQGIQDIEYTSD